MSAGRSVLALNVGSSTLKFALFSSGPAEALESLYEGTLATDGQSHYLQQHADGRQLSGDTPLAALLAHLRERALPSPQVVGHRLVHGGAQLREHVLIDTSVLQQLQDATAFAPLHLPPALALVHDAMQRLPRLPQVACLDTAFHRDLPALAQTLPLPAALRRQGLQRYGFHGLSCESIVQQLGPSSLPARLVIAHLGSGASVTAVQQGRSIDTSMSLTPTGGVVMGTRPGDLDPGVLLYLMRAHGYSARELEDLLDHHAGLQGLAGESDVRRLLEQEATREPAQLALAIWVRSVAKAIAGMAVSLGGLDRLVFTGGIGEHAAPLRQRILQQLMPLLPGLNSQVLPSQENKLIAQHAMQLTTLASTDV